MAFFNTLQVLNDMLGTLGESPLNAIDEDHPYVASGLRKLDVASWREQAKGWWFNREEITLGPDADGFIITPMDALSVDPIIPTNNFVMRGRRLYNPKTSTYVFAPGTEFKCLLIRNIPFEDLPPNAASYIGAFAVLDFQVEYDSDKAKTEKLTAARNAAFVQLNKEHIRNTNANLLTKGSTAERINSLGQGPTGSLLTVTGGNGRYG